MSSDGSGVPIHGNYHGYYFKRAFASDPRLALLSPSTLCGARVLDVGCNEGYATCEIASKWGARKAVGVDIDDTLIRSAWKRRRTVWSLQGPEEQLLNKKRKRDIDERPTDSASASTSRVNHFPASCEHMFGPLPMPSFQASDSHRFPHNVTFRVADWAENEIPEDAEGYDVVIAFSVTKWIHLNGGDDALRRFFERVYAVLKPGGLFVLEPQPWQSYVNARRMHPTLKKNLKSLRLRPDEFEGILRDVGFGSAEHLARIGDGGFKRPVDMYKKLL